MDELLKRVAWDYRGLLSQNKKLADRVGELELVREALELQARSHEAAATERKDRKDPDELARSLLASVRRAVHEQREDARREAELVLKKARERAHEIENEARAYAGSGLAELAALEALRDEVAGNLRRTLESIAAVASSDGESPVESTGEVAAHPPRESEPAPALEILSRRESISQPFE